MSLKTLFKPGINVILLVLGAVWGQVSIAQTVYATKDTAYIHAVERGLMYLKKGQCQPCLAAYKAAFIISKKSALSTMRAALCAYQCQQEELAKTYIQQAVDIDYEQTEEIWLDQEVAPEFNLARSSGMQKYVRGIFAQKDRQLGLNVALKEELATIYESDQKPRYHIDTIVRVYGRSSPQLQQHWQKISKIDSMNLASVERIIQQYGYPGRSLVGPKLQNTVWLVIQHSPLAVQEKYLPLIQNAADKGEMERSNLALLVDRIRMYKGKKQLYGSQISISPTGKKFFHPIEDKANVNKRRAKVGLEPIEEYAKEFGIKYKSSVK